ncbi:MAG: class I SAM-dependent methyltransferase [Thermodesulfovibrionales bacterium]
MVVRLHAGKSFEAFLLLSRRHFKAKYKDGMNALDVKCGMGFFSFPIARFVGKTGKVLCVDLQEKMIKGLIRRAKKAGLSDRIDASVSQKNSLMLNNVAVKIDFALAFALVYEVPDKERLLSEIRNTMKESGKRLITEPKAHVSKADFDRTISIARSVGLEVITEVAIRRSYAILMAKKQD